MLLINFELIKISLCQYGDFHINVHDYSQDRFSKFFPAFHKSDLPEKSILLARERAKSQNPTYKSYFLQKSVKIKAEINLIIFPPNNFILKQESLCKIVIFDTTSPKFEKVISNKK